MNLVYNSFDGYVKRVLFTGLYLEMILKYRSRNAVTSFIIEYIPGCVHHRLIHTLLTNTRPLLLP